MPSPCRTDDARGFLTILLHRTRPCLCGNRPGQPPESTKTPTHGVLVTNGLDVVLTGTHGCSQLPLHAKDANFSLVKPAGYAISLQNERGIPHTM